MTINWKVRFKSKEFWLGFIPLVLLLIQLLLKPFGIEFDFGKIGNYIKDLVNVVFLILAALGVVVDPTTAGVSDSVKAMTYTEPKPLEIVCSDTYEEYDLYNNLEETIDELTNGKGEDEE